MQRGLICPRPHLYVWQQSWRSAAGWISHSANVGDPATYSACLKHLQSPPNSIFLKLGTGIYNTGHVFPFVVRLGNELQIGRRIQVSQGLWKLKQETPNHITKDQVSQKPDKTGFKSNAFHIQEHIEWLLLFAITVMKHLEFTIALIRSWLRDICHTK